MATTQTITDSAPQPSFGETLGRTFLIFNAMTQTFLALFTAPFRGSGGSRIYSRHVIYTGFRTLFSGGYILAMSSTDKEYENFVKAQGIVGRTVDLEDGTKGHWLGEQDAEKTALFFHGGGYCLPAGAQHYTFCWNLIKAGKENGKSLRVMVASFELAPKARYPTHLTAAVNLLNHLLKVENMDPSNIILIGDSSGGHMVLGILSHLLHPHPSMTPILLPSVQPTSKFCSAIALSPKISASQVCTADSITRNKYKDFSSAEGLLKINQQYLGPEGKPDAWNSWRKGDQTVGEDWWSGLDEVTENVLITAGSDEIYVDDIVEVGETMKKYHKDTEIFIGQDEAHDMCMMDFALGWTGKSYTPDFVKQWVLKCL